MSGLYYSEWQSELLTIAQHIYLKRNRYCCCLIAYIILMFIYYLTTSNEFDMIEEHIYHIATRDNTRTLLYIIPSDFVVTEFHIFPNKTMVNDGG